MRARGEVVAVGVRILLAVDRVGLVHQVAVEHQLLVHQAYMIARDADGALDVIHGDVERIAEHDDVAAPRFPVRQQFAPWAGRRVYQLIHQNVIADQQRAHHGCARNYERLHQRGGAEEQQDDGYRPLRDESALHICRQLR